MKSRDIFEGKTLISWRAIEAVGLVSKEIARTSPELVRNTVGRLLWMIRDESGGSRKLHRKTQGHT